MQRPRRFAWLPIIVVLLAGCWRNSGTGEGGVPVVEFDEGPNISLTTDDGQVNITPQSGAELSADDLPEELPVPDGAEFSLISKSPQGVFATFAVPTPPASVAEFYAARLKADAWETQSRRSGDAEVISAKKAGQSLVVSIAANSPGSHVSVSLSPE